MRAVHALFLVATTVLAGWGLGCTPSIGDKCTLSTDCSVRGDRLCDTAQPGGYCTIFNCRGNLCPDDAACVLFNAAIQGCGYNDRSISRTARTFCMAQCHSNSDCRDGYICSDPRQAPWSAVLLDDDQTRRVCIVPPDNGRSTLASEPDAAVCMPSAPVETDAGGDAQGPDAGIDAGADAETDAGADADAGAADATADAGAADADSGVTDAAEGG
jgi:hypothetical protein